MSSSASSSAANSNSNNNSALAQLELGTQVSVTLVSDVTVEGCVFSVDEASGQLILMECARLPGSGPQAPFKDPAIHIVNGLFVKSISVIVDSPTNRLIHLPRSVLGDSLPVAENGDHKKLVGKIKTETKKRAGLYHESASIDACDAFEYFLKLYPDLKWSTDPEHLRVAIQAAGGNDVKLVLQVVGGSILLSGNADQDGYSWRRPKAIAAAKDVPQDLLDRIAKQAQVCSSKVV